MYYTKMIQSWINYIRTTSWENIGLDLILWYSRIVANLSVYYREACAKNPWIKWLHIQVENISTTTKRMMTRHKMDPDSASWGTIYQIYSDTKGFAADEHSYELLDDIKNPALFRTFMNRSNIRTENMYDTCVIVKTLDSVMCRRIGDGSSLPKIGDELEMSNVRFVSVEYTHPDLGEPIPIKLSKEYWQVGNELFSAAFLLRYLEYQSEPYLFDDRYKLVIMDGNMDIIELSLGQFIGLGATKYEIMAQLK